MRPEGGYRGTNSAAKERGAASPEIPRHLPRSAVASARSAADVRGQDPVSTKLGRTCVSGRARRRGREVPARFNCRLAQWSPSAALLDSGVPSPLRSVRAVLRPLIHRAAVQPAGGGGGNRGWQRVVPGARSRGCAPSRRRDVLGVASRWSGVMRGWAYSFEDGADTIGDGPEVGLRSPAAATGKSGPATPMFGQSSQSSELPTSCLILTRRESRPRSSPQEGPLHMFGRPSPHSH